MQWGDLEGSFWVPQWDFSPLVLGPKFGATSNTTLRILISPGIGILYCVKSDYQRQKDIWYCNAWYCVVSYIWYCIESFIWYCNTSGIVFYLIYIQCCNTSGIMLCPLSGIVLCDTACVWYLVLCWTLYLVLCSAWYLVLCCVVFDCSGKKGDRVESIYSKGCNMTQGWSDTHQSWW